MSKLSVRAIRSSVIGTLAMAALLFGSAGTFDYWQAWVFIAVFIAASGAITAYLAIKDPALLERRMKAGPTAEKEKSQKAVMVFAFAGFIAAIVVPAFDRRFGWSPVPASISVLGNGLVVLGFLFVFFVLRANSYSASTVQVFEGHKVVSTGPYAVVRHPMYAGVLVMLVGTPLALGSWWGLATLAVVVPALAWRLLDEEALLSRQLPGYIAYLSKVRSRLIPGVF